MKWWMGQQKKNNIYMIKNVLSTIKRKDLNLKFEEKERFEVWIYSLGATQNQKNMERI